LRQRAAPHPDPIPVRDDERGEGEFHHSAASRAPSTRPRRAIAPAAEAGGHDAARLAQALGQRYWAARCGAAPDDPRPVARDELVDRGGQRIDGKPSGGEERAHTHGAAPAQDEAHDVKGRARWLLRAHVLMRVHGRSLGPAGRGEDQ